MGLGDVDYVFYQLGDVLVALHRDGDDSAAAGGYFLDIAEGFFVLQDAAGVVGSWVAMQTTGRVSSMSALGPCFISPAG